MIIYNSYFYNLCTYPIAPVKLEEIFFVVHFHISINWIISNFDFIPIPSMLDILPNAIFVHKQFVVVHVVYPLDACQRDTLGCNNFSPECAVFLEIPVETTTCWHFVGVGRYVHRIDIKEVDHLPFLT